MPTNTPTGRVNLSPAASRMLAKMTDGAWFLTFSRKAAASISAARELHDAGLAVLSGHHNGELRVALPTLTLDNHERASVVLNTTHPEWGAKRFTRDPSAHGHHTHGTGSNSAVLFASDFGGWVVTSWLPTPAPTPDLSTLQARLLHAADLLEAKLRAAGMFDGPDGCEVADLREAATRSAHYDSVVSAWAAHTETMGALGQHLLDAHKPGEVDPEAVALLDGYHVGGRAVAPGEAGETTLEAALRLLKLAKERGAFAATEHVVSASAATGPTFRVALVDSADAIPGWVDPDEFKGANFEDGYRACVAVLQDSKVRYHWDGGEAEDNLYLRDWAWVAPALDAAYDAGRSDVLSGAVPPTETHT